MYINEGKSVVNIALEYEIPLFSVTIHLSQNNHFKNVKVFLILRNQKVFTNISHMVPEFFLSYN